jgi:hypothetical protein
MADHPARTRSKQRRLQIVLTAGIDANRHPRLSYGDFGDVDATAVPFRHLPAFEA